LSDETIARIAAAMLKIFTDANIPHIFAVPVVAVTEVTPGTSSNVLVLPNQTIESGSGATAIASEVNINRDTTVNVSRGATENAPHDSRNCRDTTVNVSRGATENAPHVKNVQLPSENSNEVTMAIVNAMLAMPNRTPLPDAPNFAGDKNDIDFDCFLDAFKNCANLNKWNEAEKLQILRAKMRGGAASFVMTLPETVKSEFERLVDALKRRYFPKEKIDLYQAQFCERVQTKTETVQELAESLKKLVRRAYPTLTDQTALDHLARNKFIEAIFDIDLRNDVRVWRKETLDATVNEAIRLEGALRIRRSEQKLIGQKQRFVSHNQPLVSFADNPSRNYLSSIAMTCYNCGRSGHKKAECRSNRHAFPRENEKKLKLCFRCNEPGHFARNCTKQLN
jgi:hypothetical protein